MYRIKYKDMDDKKTYQVHCKNEDLDLGHHPYFAFVRKITHPTHSPILQIDNQEIQRFKDTKSLILPVQSIFLIEEIEDEKSRLAGVKTMQSPQAPKTTETTPSKVKSPWTKNPLP